MSIYFDHAATTPLDPRVKKVMEPYLENDYGNPSAIYSLGTSARVAVDSAREKIAKILGVSTDEIIFTGGGTESDNLAILGVARAYRPSPQSSPQRVEEVKKKPSPQRGEGRVRGHIITTAIEHHAVLEPIQQLKNEGWEITILPVDRTGLIDPKAVEKALRPETVLVSVMYANNEIGTIQPIKEIAEVIKNYKQKESGIRNQESGKRNKSIIHDSKFMIPYFHTDACQAGPYLDLDIKKLGVDLLTLNGSKIYGPKGAGVLYCRRGIKLEPIIYGGGQENGLRSGTENVPAIVGLAEALVLVQKEKDKETKRLIKLRDYLIDGILKSVPKSFLNGHLTKRLPNNINITILDIEGEALVLYLDEEGIMCSTGSACTSYNLEPSHVLLALGLPPAVAHGSLRLTLGRDNTEKDVDQFLQVLPGIVKKLRSISPVKMKYRL